MEIRLSDRLLSARSGHRKTPPKAGLLKSLDTQSDAQGFTDSSATSLYERKIAGPDEHGKTWRLESQGEISFMNAPESSGWASNLRMLYDQTYKLRAGPYDSRYNSFRVIGPFSGDVVDDKFSSFVNQRSELWAYFVGTGEAIKNGTAQTDDPPR